MSKKIKTCFMGDCQHLYDGDNDPCDDIEVQEGKWGKCLEFKPWEREEDNGQS